MKRFLWIAILCVLLGVAGYFWFEHWYGWLTAAGVAALRIGPLFVWRVVLRFIRRRIILALFQQSPSFIKRPIRQFGSYLRRHLLGAAQRIAEVWRGSWLVRALLLVPSISVLCWFAYDAEGLVEFLYLFPIPFLFTAIFPQGFWMLLIAYIVQVMAAHGLEYVVDWFVALVPEELVDSVREAGMRWNRASGAGGRPMRERLTRWKRLAARKKTSHI